MKKYLIYGLVDPLTREIRYIGRSSTGLKRPKSHMLPSSLLKKSHKTSWIKSLIAIGRTPLIEVLQITDSSSDLNTLEVAWISYCKSLGHLLTNHTSGGGGLTGYAHTDITKASISESSKRMWREGRARKMNEDIAYRCGASMRGVTLDKAMCEKWALAKGAKTFTVFKESKKIGSWINKSECARVLGLSRKSISSCIKGLQKSHKGYTFKEAS